MAHNWINGSLTIFSVLTLLGRLIECGRIRPMIAAVQSKQRYATILYLQCFTVHITEIITRTAILCSITEHPDPPHTYNQYGPCVSLEIHACSPVPTPKAAASKHI